MSPTFLFSNMARPSTRLQIDKDKNTLFKKELTFFKSELKKNRFYWKIVRFM